MHIWWDMAGLSLANRVRGTIAHIAGVSLGQANVSSFSPWNSPAVLYSPIVRVCAYAKHSMVSMGITVAEDTSAVRAPLGCINSHCWSTIDKAIFKGSTSTYHLDLGNLKRSRIDLAWFSLGSVRVARSFDLPFIANVLLGWASKSTVAAHVSVWARAVNQLLLR